MNWFNQNNVFHSAECKLTTMVVFKNSVSIEVVPTMTTLVVQALGLGQIMARGDASRQAETKLATFATVLKHTI